VTAAPAANRRGRGDGTLGAEKRRDLLLEPGGSQMEETSGEGPPTAEVPVTVLFSDPAESAGDEAGAHGKSPAPAAEGDDVPAGATAAGSDVPAGATAPASDVTAGAPTGSQAPVSASRRRFSSRVLAAGLAALVVAALVVALILSLLDVGQKDAVNGARTSALKAAGTYAVEIGSYNYRHLQQDFAVVKEHSTPSFRSSFSQSSNALLSILSKYHATATATVAAEGVVSASPSEAVVILFLNQHVTNTAKTGGASTDHSRLEMTLERSNGRWLIDKVKLL
jgi:Mce-associated membrane protein